ncbi:MAG: hypothetical protein AAFX87_21255 [Bacteroidota bacterium]
MKKFLKILGIGILGLILIVVAIGFIAHESKPEGTKGPEAEALADKMLKALNVEAYEQINRLEWTFRGGHHYVWYKQENKVDVSWGDFEVTFYPETMDGEAAKGGVKLTGQEKDDAIQKAWAFFANDSFWLVAPFKVKDPGTERSIVKTDQGDALLVTYMSGGVTPGDSYLWILDENYRPRAWKMWVNIIPIGGLEFEWKDWQPYNGAYFSTMHTGFLEVPIIDLSVE